MFDCSSFEPRIVRQLVSTDTRFTAYLRCTLPTTFKRCIRKFRCFFGDSSILFSDTLLRYSSRHSPIHLAVESFGKLIYLWSCFICFACAPCNLPHRRVNDKVCNLAECLIWLGAFGFSLWNRLGVFARERQSSSKSSCKPSSKPSRKSSNSFKIFSTKTYSPVATRLPLGELCSVSGEERFKSKWFFWILQFSSEFFIDFQIKPVRYSPIVRLLRLWVLFVATALSFLGDTRLHSKRQLSELHPNQLS